MSRGHGKHTSLDRYKKRVGLGTYMEILREDGNRDGDDSFSAPTTLRSSKYVGQDYHRDLLRSGCRKLFELSASSFGPHGCFMIICRSRFLFNVWNHKNVPDFSMLAEIVFYVI